MTLVPIQNRFTSIRTDSSLKEIDQQSQTHVNTYLGTADVFARVCEQFQLQCRFDNYVATVITGMRLAEATLFLFCSRSLATLNIAKVKRGNTVIDPIINYTPGAISHACPFECAITPRSANSEALA